MTDPNDSAGGGRVGPDLRTITARLTDLQRKCQSVGLRTNEATEMETRIAEVLERLGAGEDDEPVPYGDLARRLFPVERFFESNGFLSVAKEVAHVEHALEALASPGPSEPSGAIELEAPDEAETRAVPDDDSAVEPTASPSRWALPRPVAAILVLFLVAMAVCAAVVVHRQSTPTVVPALPDPTPRPAPPPTATPAPLRPAGPQAQSPGARLAEEIGRARLALVDGDVDRAMDHISLAALVDADHATVLGAAEQVVALLVGRSDAAADAGDWSAAEAALERAERVATRFGLDTAPIEDAAFRHRQMARYRVVQPSDLAAIRAAAGRRVTLHYRNGSTRESVIEGVADGELLLEEDTAVRGGTVTYTDRVPLTDLEHLRVWED